jgi:hypothetical protein
VAGVQGSMASSKNIGGRPIHALWHQLSADGNPQRLFANILKNIATQPYYRRDI